MQTDYNVSILIVTHNHGKYLEKLIKSLEQFNYKDVYFCDANSADETIDILKNSIFKKNILFKKTLEGFAKNNNDLIDRKSTRLNSSHVRISYAVFCLKKKLHMVISIIIRI